MGVTTPGVPFTRYPAISDESISIEAGCKLESSVPASGDVEAGFLTSGPVAYALHSGHYDSLRETYSALEQWMAQQGVHPAGPPWEVYVTDPGELPNPDDWRTEVYWPIAD